MRRSRRAAKTLRGIKSFWIKNAECIVENDKITMFRVNGKISFPVEERNSRSDAASPNPSRQQTRAQPSQLYLVRQWPAPGPVLRPAQAGAQGDQRPLGPSAQSHSQDSKRAAGQR